MDHAIVWTEDAQENYRQIAIYLLDAYGFDTADAFTDTVNAKLRILEKSPFIGRRLDALPSVRKLPVQPYNMVYYAIAERQVIILNILDSRRYPTL
ncbi:plasmid stabilization system protein ParE [Spirosoma oryzae]|uniref:Plasmid stabilization system protein ParE n=1 Tax=Spirosoma oryzae TaxID=1469603 RepID=A0A2T0RUJ1_9BACT|nr:type II toxin-antitoxin system RelE/ParE family toxin [Spirosoma oryzae]PRY24808.1 plasmid stabilization system protein ParE [Spirosoma oryzae]